MPALDRRSFLTTLAGGAIALGAPSLLTAKPDSKPLNVVFILADDMGWTDVSCYGSEFYETPNIDRLASQGMRFTDAYAACCVCSPTRASILTGKYPARLRITDFISGKKFPYAKLRRPDFTLNLPIETITIADALKTKGYATGCFGKWHVSNKNNPDFAPDKQGFDESEVVKVEGEDPKKIGAITTSACDFMEAYRDEPFFVYVPHHAVHIPVQAKKELTAKYEKKLKPGQAQHNPQYAAMVEHLDDGVGRLMDKLDELGIADRTVVFFMSDNGGLLYKGPGGPGSHLTSNAPLRNGKGSPYEGGVREPMIVRWPGVVQAGSECATPVISVDFYPTILEMAGAKMKRKQIVDGVSLTPLLRQSGDLDPRALYWHYPHYHHTTPNSSIREGDMKLIEFYEDGALELYNLKDDIGETKNLATAMPKEARRLRKMLQAHLKEVDAQMPTPNPNYDPEKTKAVNLGIPQDAPVKGKKR